MRLSRPRRAAAVLALTATLALPLAGCGDSASSSASSSTPTTGTQSLAAATTALGAAAMEALQDVKGGVAAGQGAQVATQLKAARAKFDASLDSVKSAVTSGSADQAAKAQLAAVGSTASAALDVAIIAAASGHTGTLKAAVNDLQSALGRVLAAHT